MKQEPVPVVPGGSLVPGGSHYRHGDSGNEEWKV